MNIKLKNPYLLFFSILLMCSASNATDSYTDRKGNKELAESDVPVIVSSKEITTLLKTDKSPYLFFIFAGWATESIMMEKNVIHQKAFRERTKNTKLLIADVTKDTNMLSALKVIGPPALVYVNNGMVKSKLHGYNDTEMVIKWMNRQNLP